MEERKKHARRVEFDLHRHLQMERPESALQACLGFLDFVAEEPDLIIKVQLQDGEVEVDLGEARTARQCREIARELLMVVKSDGRLSSSDIAKAMHVTFTVGQLVETLSGRWTELARIEIGRSKGGKATRKLNAEQQKFAIGRIQRYHTGNVSKSAACRRAKGDILKEYEIDVSEKMLLRIYNAQLEELDNA